MCEAGPQEKGTTSSCICCPSQLRGSSITDWGGSSQGLAAMRDDGGAVHPVQHHRGPRPRRPHGRPCRVSGNRRVPHVHLAREPRGGLRQAPASPMNAAQLQGRTPSSQRIIQKRQTTPTWVPPRRRIALANTASLVPLAPFPAQTSTADDGGTKASCPATGTTTVQMIGAALSIARGSSLRLSTLRS